MGVGIASIRRKRLMGGEVKQEGGSKKSLGTTVAERISIFPGPFQYTRNGREPNLR